MWLSRHLPSPSPLARDWPSCPRSLRLANSLMKKLYHRNRVRIHRLMRPTNCLTVFSLLSLYHQLPRTTTTETTNYPVSTVPFEAEPCSSSADEGKIDRKFALSRSQNKLLLYCCTSFPRRICLH